MKRPFIIRVYGIYREPERGYLVSDELVRGKRVTKFPGGGLEYGEGPIDCLKREMKEETGEEFRIGDHLYTTDFFVESAFDPGYQVISIYYRLHSDHVLDIRVSTKLFDFQGTAQQSFRFIKSEEMKPEHFTLIIDQKVASLLAMTS